MRRQQTWRVRSLGPALSLTHVLCPNQGKSLRTEPLCGHFSGLLVVHVWVLRGRESSLRQRAEVERERSIWEMTRPFVAGLGRVGKG